MSGGVPQSLKIYAVLLLLCFLSFSCNSSKSLKTPEIVAEIKDALLPQIPPSEAPQPLLPLLAPSPFSPFTNSTIPKLSGLCTLDFAATESMMSMTSIDCVGSFAPYLANVICCPQVETTLTILIGQSSKETNMLALNGTVAEPCLSDFQEILVGQGANDTLHEICSIHPSNLTEGSCPIKDVVEFEKTVNASSLLSACGKIDNVNECCEQVCQNALVEAADKLAEKAYDLMNTDVTHALADHSTRVNDCKIIALRWLASKLQPTRAKEVLRGLSNCKINKVCPLVFPNMSHVTKTCGTGSSDPYACCSAVDSFVSHLQNQSFVTNLQALNCAASLGLKLQKANITRNIYSMCHISLKDFSVQVTPQGVESGCLLPSLPTDAVFDSSTGLSFLCDLNDNIPAPWPSPTQIPASSCNKTVKIPALPAAASGQTSIHGLGKAFLAIFFISAVKLLMQI
ncbi:OLC1v1021209C1 [Oldenlandia corymbosa var. corymbosa]|uniref:OLC1v1021209C1 n=1 Tax=Oldenlandia corymbosa var. corymbosa TaxID=529605 RepID=A0AAV1BV56_OLDCO|nr:OLC1v1021209C1 [Oldenlandia corymbosa var. corymbosa]